MKLTTLFLALVLVAAAPAADKVDVTGKWNLSVETSAGSGSPTAEFKQEGEKLTGSYRGTFGESQVEGTVKEKKIEFKVRFKVEGNDAVFSYTGTIEDNDSMKGKVDLGGFAEGTWTGTRVKEEKKE